MYIVRYKIIWVVFLKDFYIQPKRENLWQLEILSQKQTMDFLLFQKIYPVWQVPKLEKT